MNKKNNNSFPKVKKSFESSDFWPVGRERANKQFFKGGLIRSSKSPQFVRLRLGEKKKKKVQNIGCVCNLLLN